MGGQGVRMFRGWTVRGLSGPIEIVPISEIQFGTRQTRPPMGLDCLLDAWLGDPVCRQQAIEMYRTSGGSPDLTGWAYDARDANRLLKAHLREALLRGDLMVLPRPVSPGSYGTSESEGGQAATASGKASAQTSWIEIYLRDERGQPVPGKKYWLKLPDGRVQEGNLDDFGHAEYYGISPGICEVSFPDLEAGDWDFA